MWDVGVEDTFQLSFERAGVVGLYNVMIVHLGKERGELETSWELGIWEL
jgi:hypothetical protein